MRVPPNHTGDTLPGSNSLLCASRLCVARLRVVSWPLERRKVVVSYLDCVAASELRQENRLSARHSFVGHACKIVEVRPANFGPAQPAAEQQCQDGPVAQPGQRFWIRRVSARDCGGAGRLEPVPAVPAFCAPNSKAMREALIADYPRSARTLHGPNVSEYVLFPCLSASSFVGNRTVDRHEPHRISSRH